MHRKNPSHAFKTPFKLRLHLSPFLENRLEPEFCHWKRERKRAILAPVHEYVSPIAVKIRHRRFFETGNFRKHIRKIETSFELISYAEVLKGEFFFKTSYSTNFHVASVISIKKIY